MQPFRAQPLSRSPDDDMRPETSPSDVSVVGVCHVTATADSEVDVSQLLVRLVMTRDVASAEVATVYARGTAAASQELSDWMKGMCGPDSCDDSGGGPDGQHRARRA